MKKAATETVAAFGQGVGLDALALLYDYASTKAQLIQLALLVPRRRASASARNR